MKRIIIRHEFFKVLPFLSLTNGILWTLIFDPLWCLYRIKNFLFFIKWQVAGGWCLDGPSRRSIAADYFIPPPPPHLCLAHDAVLMCWVGLLADCCYCMGKIAVPEIKTSALHIETICLIFRISISILFFFHILR